MPTSSPPEIVHVDHPDSVPIDGSYAHGTIWFRDPDGDITWLVMETVDAVDFKGGEWNPMDFINEGDETEGASSFRVWCEGSQCVRQYVTQRMILFDEAGNESEPFEFSFYVE